MISVVPPPRGPSRESLHGRGPYLPIRWRYARRMGGGGKDFSRVRSPFEGALVRLRAVEEQDLASINEGIWNPEVTQQMSIALPEALAQTRQFWKSIRSSASDVLLAIETLAGEFVGGVGLHGIDARNRQAELGIWIARPYWDKGYGTDAVRVASRLGFREMNLQRVFLRVYETNPRGRRAYEKVGFKEEGRLRRSQFIDGQYVDVIMMGLLAEDLIED
jgi:RimJ/RimL family protein N-acetyltransferase